MPGSTKASPHVHAYNVDDLKEVVAQNQESRRRMAQEAELLLEEEVAAFEGWWQSLETVPTINSLRDKIEGIREQELEKALSRLGIEFGEKQQEIIEALTRGIVNKILHDPMVEIRSLQDLDQQRQAMDSLIQLMNYPAASGRGIRIKKEPIPHLCKALGCSLLCSLT